MLGIPDKAHRKRESNAQQIYRSFHHFQERHGLLPVFKHVRQRLKFSRGFKNPKKLTRTWHSRITVILFRDSKTQSHLYKHAHPKNLFKITQPVDLSRQNSHRQSITERSSAANKTANHFSVYQNHLYHSPGWDVGRCWYSYLWCTHKTAYLYVCVPLASFPSFWLRNSKCWQVAISLSLAYINFSTYVYQNRLIVVLAEK